MNAYAYLDENNVCCRVDHAEQEIACSEEIIKLNNRNATEAAMADSADGSAAIIENPLGMKYVDGEWIEVEQPPVELPETMEELIERKLANFSIIKSIQRGIVKIPGSGEAKTIKINKVNFGKTLFFPIGNGRNGVTAVGVYSFDPNIYISGYGLDGNDCTSFDISSSHNQPVGADGLCSWQVIEFE